MNKEQLEKAITKKNPKWKLGFIDFDEKNDTLSLKNYSWQIMSELFSTIAMFIGLSLKEFKEHGDGVPQWCFNDLSILYDNEEHRYYSEENNEKAKEYFKDRIDKTSKLFLDFVDSKEDQEDVDAMFDALKEIFLSLWK